MSEAMFERPRGELASTEAVLDPTKVSPSRVNKLTECGIAFRLQYVDKVPKRVNSSFALFGSVVHKALEKWGLDRSQDLLGLMRQAWLSETEEAKVVREFLAEYSKINVSILKAEKAAAEEFEKRMKRPTKAPRMTKHFKESDAAKKLAKLYAVWIPKLEAESPWRFTERDPLPQFYDDSLVLAKRYEKQWKHLPPVLHSEFGFDIPWRGFKLNGYIDTIEILVDRNGEVKGIGVKDYKSYKNEPPEQKDYRQLVMYDVAVRYLVENGIIVLPYSLDDYPLYVGIDYVRFAGVECEWLADEGQESSGGNSIRWWRMTEADHDRLERELKAYKSQVENENYLPAAKGTNPQFCDYGELCCMVSTTQAGGCAERVELAL